MIVNKGRAHGVGALGKADMALLMIIPFRISAEQIGVAFPDQMKTDILDLRRRHSRELQCRLEDLYAPLKPDRFASGLTVLENALFGKVSDAAGSKADELRKVVAQCITDAGLEPLIIGLIFEVPLSLGGGNLPALYAEPLALGRATIKKPDVLILDDALASYDVETQVSVYRNLRSLLPDTMLIYLSARFEIKRIFDAYFELEQGRIASDDTQAESPLESAASADMVRKLRALQQTKLFSGLDRKQLRLLAFGARWYYADAGEYVFRKNDAPTDGAYMLIKGKAGLYLPDTGDGERLVSTVGPGQLVGELGLIRNVPRALDMKARTGLTCLRIGAKDFLAVVENDAATAFRLLQVVSGYVSN